ILKISFGHARPVSACHLAGAIDGGRIDQHQTFVGKRDGLQALAEGALLVAGDDRGGETRTWLGHTTSRRTAAIDAARRDPKRRVSSTCTHRGHSRSVPVGGRWKHSRAHSAVSPSNERRETGPGTLARGPENGTRPPGGCRPGSVGSGQPGPREARGQARRG